MLVQAGISALLTFNTCAEVDSHLSDSCVQNESKNEPFGAYRILKIYCTVQIFNENSFKHKYF